jgi:Domain of unknown function (DUF4157)
MKNTAYDSVRNRAETSTAAPQSRRDQVASRMLHLQSAIGNRGVAQLFAASPSGAALRRQRNAVVEATAPAVEAAAVRQQLSSSEPIPSPLSDLMERGYGRDFADVRIHADRTANGLADRQLANAFTIGHDIFFARDRWRPHTADGDRLLAHELAHVVQQTGGGGAGPGSPALEASATASANEVSSGHIGVPVAGAHRRVSRVRTALPISRRSVAGCSHTCSRSRRSDL